jgi:hypothetical protein
MTTPADVTGLRLWLKADAITGLADGAGVSTWSDSSGLGNDAVNAVAGLQPTYQTNEVTGLPCVRFDGTDDRLDITNANMLAASNNAAGFTAFAYVNLSTPSFASRDIYSISNGVDGTAARIKFGQRAATLGEWSMSGRRLDADVAQNLVGNQTQTGWQLLTFVSDWANDDAFIYRDGNLEASTTTWLTAGNTSATNALACHVGSAPSAGSEFWIGDIAELVVYDNAVSTTDRLNLWAYFQAKYAPPIGRHVHRGPGHRRGPLGRMDLLRAYHHRHRSTEITVVSGALTGDVSATVTETDTVTAVVGAVGAVSATVTCGSTVTAVVGTIGAVTATVTCDGTVTGVTGAVGVVSATVTCGSTVTASVTSGVVGSVTVTVTCGSTVTAVVGAVGAISATVTCGVTVTAVVGRVGAVTATVTCGSTVTAVDGKVAAVTATVVCGSTVTAAVTAGPEVLATVTSGSTVTAVLGVVGSVTSTVTSGSTFVVVRAITNASVTGTVTANSTVTAVILGAITYGRSSVGTGRATAGVASTGTTSAGRAGTGLVSAGAAATGTAPQGAPGSGTTTIGRPGGDY